MHSLDLIYSGNRQKSRCSIGITRIYSTHFSQFDFGVYRLISVCTYQYAEYGLVSIIRFVGIRIIFVLRLSFAELKRNEILSLCTGDHLADNHQTTQAAKHIDSYILAYLE